MEGEQRDAKDDPPETVRSNRRPAEEVVDSRRTATAQTQSAVGFSKEELMANYWPT